MPVLPASGYSYPQAPSVSPAADAGSPYQSAAGATPEAFGYGIGTALNHVAASAEAASNSFSRIQENFNATAADDAVNKAEDRVNKILYGDPDQGQDGFLQLRGDNAMRAYPEVRKQLDKAFQDHRAALQNPMQQQRFDHQVRQLRTSTLSQMGRHNDVEFHTYQTQEAKAREALNTSKVASAAAEGDQTAFDGYVSKSIADAQVRASRLGLPPEAAEADKVAIKQHAIKSWAESMAARGDAVGADAFVDRNRASAGDAYDNLKREFHEKAKAQQINNAVFGGPVMPGPTPMVRGGATESRIAQVAQAQNVDPTTALATASIESSMGRNLGSRGNIFQLGKTEWASVGGGQMGDPDTDIRNGISFLAKTKDSLSGKLGREPQPWEIYLAHQQGVGGATALLNNPSTPAGQLLPPQNISANGGNPNAPASAFAALWRDKFTHAASRVGGTASTAAATVAAAAPAADSTLAVGDSIAAHLVRKAGVGGQESGQVAAYNPGDTAVSGYNPANVLKVISNIPADTVRGKNVVLSTGTSNDPQNQWQSSIPEQIKALYGKGAANVTVMGVGTKFADRNATLAQIAADNKATFSGPLRKVAGDGIHSSDPQAELAAVLGAKSGQPTTPAPPPPDQTMRPDSAVPGLQAKLAEIDQRAQAEGWPADVYRGAYNLARERLNAAYTDEQRQQRADKVANDKIVSDAENEVIADHYSEAPKLTAAQVSVDPRFNADPQARMRMLAMLKPDRTAVDPVTSSNTMHDLMRQITNGEITDRGPVLDAFNAQPARLNDTHLNFLLKQLDDVRTPEGLKVGKDIDKLISSVKASITKSNPLMGSLDASGDLNLGAFEEDIRRNVDLMRKEKKTPAEIADYLSVKRFRDDPSLLSEYQKTIQESSRDIARSMGRGAAPPPAPAPALVPAPASQQEFYAPIPPAPSTAPPVEPRKPGESAADYMKRIGGGLSR